MSALLSAPFELLCKISTYLATPELAVFSVLCKICHQSSKSQHIIDLTDLETSYSVIQIREMLSILKYHQFKTWKLPTSLILSDPVINRLISSQFKLHTIIGAHKYLTDVYYTDINTLKNRQKQCLIDTLTLSGYSRLISLKNYPPPPNIMNSIINNLKLLHLNISTSRIIRLNQFVASQQTLKTLIISSRNLLTKHNNSLQIHYLFKFAKLETLTIKNESLTECIEDSNLELPSKLFICLSQWILYKNEKLNIGNTDSINYDYEYEDNNDFKYGIDYNRNASLRAEIKCWSINIKHLTLTKQYIQLPLDVLLSLLAKYRYLLTVNIEYCVFIDEYDKASHYDPDSVYYHQTWMQQYDDGENGDDFAENAWKRQLNGQLLEYVNKLSLCHKFQSESLDILCFKGINVTGHLLKVIAERFGATLTNLSLITCNIPYIQYDWKYFSIKCVKLKTLNIHNPALEISTKCIKNTNGYDLYQFASPLKILFVTKVHKKQKNFKYKNLYFILKDILNDDAYYEAMHDQYTKKHNNNNNIVNKIPMQYGTYKLSANDKGDTIIIKQTEKHFITTETLWKYRKHSVNICVKYKNNMDVMSEDNRKPLENMENMDKSVECKYCGIDVAKMDIFDHIETQCLEAIIKCTLCDMNIRRNNLAVHWLEECVKYECICTICLQVFIGRQRLLNHYLWHDIIADKDQSLYQFNWHSHKMDNKLFALYPVGTIWICNRCNHRSLNLRVKMAKMIPFQVHNKRIPNIAEICEQCRTPRFVDKFRIN